MLESLNRIALPAPFSSMSPHPLDDDLRWLGEASCTGISACSCGSCLASFHTRVHVPNGFAPQLQNSTPSAAYSHGRAHHLL